MKKIITEELGYMKYLLGYTRGVVISEQTTPYGVAYGAEQGFPWNNPAPAPTYPSEVAAATAAAAAAAATAAAAPPAAAALPESENKANWEDVVKYYEGNTDPNWKFEEKDKKEVNGIMYEFVIVNLTDTNDADAFMIIYDDGDVYIWNRGQGTGGSYIKWEWDGTKPVIKFKDISKNASGYVQPTDTDWSAVTENNKIIGLNAKGPLVKQVQNKLINIGYSGTTSGSITTDVAGCGDDVEKCDGIYGKLTKEMVKQYQKDNDLSVDGNVGQQTYDAMF